VGDGPSDDLALCFDDYERKLFLEPLRNVFCRPRLGLEGGQAILDALVVDPCDRKGIRRFSDVGGPDRVTELRAQ
jgi:hypothetical protein